MKPRTRCVVDGPLPGCDHCGRPLPIPPPGEATPTLVCGGCGHEHDLEAVILRAFSLAHPTN